MECGGKEVRADAVWVSMPFRVEGPVINALAFLPRLIAVLGRHYLSAARTPALSRIAQERGPWLNEREGCIMSALASCGHSVG